MANWYVDGVSGSDSNGGTSPTDAMQTIQAGVNLLSDGDTCWAKSNSLTPYLVTAAITFPSGITYDSVTQLRGYGTTIGDGVKALIQANTTAISILNINQNGVVPQDLLIDGNNQSGVTGVSQSAAYCGISTCKVQNCPVAGIYQSNGYGINRSHYCEVYNCGIGINSAGSAVCGCYVHGCSSHGIQSGHDAIIDNIVASNGGCGIYVNSWGSIIRGNAVDANSSHGIYLSNNFLGIVGSTANNILSNNGGYGVTFTYAGTGTPVVPEIDFNAYYNNTSGARQYLSAGPHEITLSGSPYNNPSSGDYSLNSTSGAGAACKGSGFPGTMPGALSVGYRSVGAIDPNPSGGGGSGGGVLYLPGMNGGMG